MLRALGSMHFQVPISPRRNNQKKHHPLPCRTKKNMATTSRKSSKNLPTDKRSRKQDLVTTSPPQRKWTPILWSRSTRKDKSRSSGRNGHDKPSSSALAREIRGIVFLLFGIFLAGALAAEGYTQLHGKGGGHVRGNFGWTGAL